MILKIHRSQFPCIYLIITDKNGIFNIFLFYCRIIFSLNTTQFIYLFIFVFLGPHLQLMEFPWLGVELELQLVAYTTATPDPSCVWDLHHSSWQPWILNPLRRLGIEPTSSGNQLGLLMTEPQRELLFFFLKTLLVWFLGICLKLYPLSEKPGSIGLKSASEIKGLCLHMTIHVTGVFLSDPKKVTESQYFLPICL